MFNVKQIETGQLMLGSSVESFVEAHKWLLYYRNKYPVGKPYPNGKGVYHHTYELVAV